MSRAALLGSLFLSGCAAHSLIAWLGATRPETRSLVVTIYFIISLLWLGGLIFDDAVYPAIGLKRLAYLGLLGGFALSMTIGAGVVWLLS